jgi:hypothetical protein
MLTCFFHFVSLRSNKNKIARFRQTMNSYQEESCSIPGIRPNPMQSLHRIR